MDLPRLAIRLHSAIDARRSAELASCAEECGFHGVWFAENPYQRGVLPAMTACVLATESIEIGIGVFNPYNRHPSLMAMEIGALDELSGGRTTLGIGSGVPEWINHIVPYSKPLSAVRDAVTIARALLAGEEVSYSGEMFSAQSVKLGYELKRERVPVYVAAMGERMLRLCGEIGDGLLIGNMCPPKFTQRAIRLMSEGATPSGRLPPVEVAKYVPCVVGDDSADARRVARSAIGGTLSAFWTAFQSTPSPLSAIADDNGIDPDTFSRALQRLANGEPGEEALDDSFIRAYGVAGTLDECLEQCHQLGESGATQLTLTFLGDHPEASMRQFGDAVGSYR